MSSATSSPDRLSNGQRRDPLSHDQLHEHMLRLAGAEREATLSVIDHLIEIHSHRVHQRRGHSSLYSYCINELGYSRSAAHLRIVAARTIRRWPRVRRLLRERRLTLSTLAAVSDSLTPDNYRDLLNRIAGKSQQEVERILAELGGVRPSRERISQVTTVAPGDSGVGTRLGLGPGAATDVSGHRPTQTGAGGASTLDKQPVAGKAVGSSAFASGTRGAQLHEEKQVNPRRVEHRYRYEFTGSAGFMRKYQKAAALLSNRLPAGVTIEAVFEMLLDEFLERNDPARREMRRSERRARRNGGGGVVAGSANGGNNGGSTRQQERPSGGSFDDGGHNGGTDGARDAANGGVSDGGNGRASAPDSVRATDGGGATAAKAAAERRIPAAVRDRVYERDGGRCTFRGTDGRRCDETRRLHIDHIVPWALGGGHAPDNLRLLCSGHNQLQAERLFGREHTEQHREQHRAE